MKYNAYCMTAQHLTPPGTRERELGTTDRSKIEKEVLRSIIKGRDVRRYRLNQTLDYLLFPYVEKDGEFVVVNDSSIKRFPRAFAQLTENRDKLENRIWFGKGASELSGHWYGLMYLDSARSFRSAHLLTPSLSNKSNFTIGSGDLFATGTAGVTSIIPVMDLPENIHYLLGVLNSRLLSLYATRHSPVFSGGYYKFSAPYLRNLPIRRIDMSNRLDKQAHDRTVALVQQMLDLHQHLPKARTDHERTALQREIDHTDAEIDRLVYQLYGLTDEEIALVEGATK